MVFKAFGTKKTLRRELADYETTEPQHPPLSSKSFRDLNIFFAIARSRGAGAWLDASLEEYDEVRDELVSTLEPCVKPVQPSPATPFLGS